MKKRNKSEGSILNIYFKIRDSYIIFKSYVLLYENTVY